MSDDTHDKVYRLKPHEIVTKPPERVVSLVPSMTETMLELGFDAQLVGITDDCLYPADRVAAKPRLGPLHAVRVDDVIALRPDRVIVNREENGKADIDALAAAGLNVWQTFPRTVMDAVNLIWDLLHSFMVDNRYQYERVNLINRTVDWVGSASEARANEGEVCRVFVPLLASPLTTFGADTYAHDLLKTAGGTNVFSAFKLEPTSDDPAQDLNRYPTVTLADVEAASPDVVLLPGFPLGFTEDDVAQFNKLDIPAAQSGQVYLIDGTLLTYHGVRMVRALNEISDLLCPVVEVDEDEV
jgi:ABC-type Fe3+-hydroxamate transport system substrate-binding protein